MDKHNLPKKILLVDDDPGVAEALEPQLRKHNIALMRAIDIQTALYLFNQQIFEVVVLELEFGPLPGLALAQKMRTTEHTDRRNVGVVITSGQGRKATDEGLASEIGDIELVIKPLNDIKLLPALVRALAKRRNAIEYDELRSKVYHIWQVEKNVTKAADLAKSGVPKHGLKVMSMLSHLYEDAAMPSDALAVVDAILQKKQDDVAMLNLKGRLLLKIGDAVKARECLEKADALAPKNLERLELMASMYLKMDLPDASVDKMRELINLNPERPEIKFDLFRSLEDAGYASHAIGLCRETTLPQEVVRYYNNKGVAMSKTGDHEAAVKEYEAALQFYPTFRENYRIYWNIALAETNQKTPKGRERARAALHKCLDLCPDFEKAKTLLASIEGSNVAAS